MEFAELLFKTLNTFLLDSLEIFLLNNKISKEERRGAEKFMLWMREQLEQTQEKANRK